MISRAAFDLLLKEPFYAHVLAGMPRLISTEAEKMGVHWNGQQAVLRVNPFWFRKELSATRCPVALKHEILHIVFRHLFRPADMRIRPPPSARQQSHEAPTGKSPIPAPLIKTRPPPE